MPTKDTIAVKVCIPCEDPTNIQKNANGHACKCTVQCICCKNRPKPPTKRCKYIQPKMRQSYRPDVGKYKLPALKMEDGTIYRNSYLPCKGEISTIVTHENNLTVGEGKMSGDTVHKLSFQDTKGALPARLIIPCEHSYTNDDPMQDITTHKHDYVPKPLDKLTQFRPTQNLFTSEDPLSDQTTNRLSYMPVDLNKAKAFASIRPVNNLGPATGKVDGNTVHKMSYQPWEPQAPIDKPWVEKRTYEKPTLRMSDYTIYRGSYLSSILGEKPHSYKPISTYYPPTLKVDGETIYRKSYLPCASEIPSKFIPTNNLCVGEGKMSDDTIHRMSFQGQNVPPACLVIPCEHNLLGHGPMQDITTHKHDFVPKPFDKVNSFKPTINLMASDQPLSDKTTSRLSYMPQQIGKDPIIAYRPQPAIELPTGKMDGNTVHKLSYLPWKPQPPEEKPWVPRGQYVPPQLRMDGNTIHTLSFAPPGYYQECAENDPDCIPCPEPPCDPRDVKPCCETCCCYQFPTAAC